MLSAPGKQEFLYGRLLHVTQEGKWARVWPPYRHIMRAEIYHLIWEPHKWKGGRMKPQLKQETLMTMPVPVSCLSFQWILANT